MSALAKEIIAALKSNPKHFSEVVDAHMDVPWREFLKAWGEVRWEGREPSLGRLVADWEVH